MPNFCHNELLVFDKPDAEDDTLLELFRRRAVGPEPVYKSNKIEALLADDDPALNELCFNQFLPVPPLLLTRYFGAEDVVKAEAEGVDDCVSGYDWQAEHWGTKWGAWDVTVDTSLTLTYRFFTAWSWPLPVVAKMAQLYPGLQFQLLARTEYDCYEGLYYARFERGLLVCKMDPQNFKAAGVISSV